MFDSVSRLVPPEPAWPSGIFWSLPEPPPGWKVVGRRQVTQTMHNGDLIHRTLYEIKPEGVDLN